MGFFGGGSPSGKGDTDVSGAEAVASGGKYTTYSDKKKINQMKKDKFKYQGSENIDKAKLPGTAGVVLEFMKEPFKKGSIITREFFQDEVLGSEKFKYDGEVMGADKFRDLSSFQQEQVYKEYIDNRNTGKTDAYGNPLSGGGPRDNPGITMAGSQAKAAQKKAVEEAPDGPTNIELTATSTDKDLTAAQKKLKANREGRKSTILDIDQDDLTLDKKRILG